MGLLDPLNALDDRLGVSPEARWRRRGDAPRYQRWAMYHRTEAVLIGWAVVAVGLLLEWIRVTVTEATWDVVPWLIFLVFAVVGSTVQYIGLGRLRNRYERWQRQRPRSRESGESS